MDIQSREINHIRFYFQQIDKLRAALTDEQMGHLFFAVADYAMTGHRQEVEPALIFPFGELCYSIDKRRMGI